MSLKIEVTDKNRIRIHIQKWLEMGTLIYGKNRYKWKFKCPKCGKVQTAQDFITYIDDVDECFIKAGHHCLSRYSRKTDVNCFWTLDGVYKIHKVELIVPEGTKEHIMPVFEFADAPVGEAELGIVKVLSPLLEPSIFENQGEEVLKMWKEMSEGNPELEKVGRKIFGDVWDV